jgi:hypothetical protein
MTVYLISDLFRKDSYMFYQAGIRFVSLVKCVKVPRVRRGLTSRKSIRKSTVWPRLVRFTHLWRVLESEIRNRAKHREELVLLKTDPTRRGWHAGPEERSPKASV